MPNQRPAFDVAAPGGVVVTTDGTSQAITIPAGSTGCWVHFTGNGFFSVESAATPFAMTDLNSGPIVGGFLYGPFTFSPGSGSDRYVHVAGSGGTPTATVTFV
jgi:hypothetical protein